MFEPKYQVSPQLLDTIKRIVVLVHELNKQQVGDVVLAQLRSEAQATSAYASTAIEGNPLPLTEVKRLLKSRPEHIRQSEREVLNYNQALLWLYQHQQFALAPTLLCELHRQVMAGLLPNELVGRWRREPVVVRDPRTGGAVYLAPDHQDVERLVDDLMAFVEAQRNVLDPLLLAGLFHKQCVIIHPFVDGNGRTTRLATNILLAGLGINFFPLLSFENYYNQNVTRYFQMVGVFGDYYELAPNLDFTPWLEYFAEGILDELLRLAQVLERRHGPGASSPAERLEVHHRLILAIIDEQGFVTDRDYAQRTARAKATRSLDFRKLIELGLIVRRGRGRSIYYQRTLNR
jgi:Fic family protein